MTVWAAAAAAVWRNAIPEGQLGLSLVLRQEGDVLRVCKDFQGRWPENKLGGEEAGEQSERRPKSRLCCPRLAI